MTLTNFPHKLRIYIHAEHMWRGNWYLAGAGERVWLYNFYFGPSVKSTLPEGVSTSTRISHSFRAFQARLSGSNHGFHVRLVRMFVTACFCFLARHDCFHLGHILWRFLTVSCGISGSAGRAGLFLVRTCLSVRHQKPLKWWWESLAVEKKNKKNQTCRGVRASWRATQKRDPVITRSWPLATAFNGFLKFSWSCLLQSLDLCQPQSACLF